MANLKLVKLSSGMELIGDHEASPEGAVLNAAFQVVVQQVNETQFSLGLAPLSVAADGAEKGLYVTRPWADVLGVYEPTTLLRDTYQQMTGGIITPSKPVLVK